jgi:hypothetical protein
VDDFNVGKVNQALRYARFGLQIGLAHTIGVDGCCTCWIGEKEARGEVDKKGRPYKCATPGKHPYAKGWMESTSNDPAIVEHMFTGEDGHEYLNYLIKPDARLLVLDVDNKPDKDGFATVQEASGMTIAELDQSTAAQMTVNSGRHYIYQRTVSPYLFKVAFAPGLDLPIQCIGGGSRARDRNGRVKQYRTICTKAPQPEPAWLSKMVADWIAKCEMDSITAAVSKAGEPLLDGKATTPEALRELITRIDPNCGYWPWVQACWGAADAPGIDEATAREIAEEWSSGGATYDPRTFEIMWNSNKLLRGDKGNGNGDRIHYGTLVHLARGSKPKLMERVMTGEESRLVTDSGDDWMFDLPKTPIPKRLRDLIPKTE